jgi:hypothetical protein
MAQSNADELLQRALELPTDERLALASELLKASRGRRILSGQRDGLQNWIDA